MQESRIRLLIFAACFTLLAVVPTMAQHQMAGHQAGSSLTPAITRAIAVLHPTAGNQANGLVVFTQDGKDVKVVADVIGLKPNGKHGFHVHEFGDCSAVDAASAGGHFNPMGMPHGAPGDAHRHGGDFGNLEANAEGKAHLELTLSDVTLNPGSTGLLGRGVIVHLSEDDLKTQPTGNAGARIACGTIGIAKDGTAK